MKKYLFLLLLLCVSAASAQTIADKLTTINNIKLDIKAALASKSQTVGDDFSIYDDAVASITTAFAFAGRDWTLATTSSLVNFQEDYVSLFNSITNASGTNADSYNHFRYFYISNISKIADKYTPPFSQIASSSIGTYTQGPAAVAANYAFRGGVLMPNGKV